GTASRTLVCLQSSSCPTPAPPQRTDHRFSAVPVTLRVLDRKTGAILRPSALRSRTRERQTSRQEHLHGRNFGTTITLATRRATPSRWIGERHVREDLGFMPAFADWMSGLEGLIVHPATVSGSYVTVSGRMRSGTSDIPTAGQCRGF